MTPLTWRELLTPDYVLAFLEAFLLFALPALGVVSAVGNGGVIQLHAWPSVPSLAGAVLVGLLNGLRAVHTLRMPPPAKNDAAAGH